MQRYFKAIPINATSMKKPITLVIVLLLCTINLKAQVSASASHTITLNLTNAIELTFTQGTSGVGLVFNSSDAYLNGIESSNAAAFKVRSNREFNVSVKSATSNFNSTTNTVMPVNNTLKVKETGSSNYVNINSSDQTLLAGQQKGNKDYFITYKATPGFGYDGGVYTVNIVYTATQQ
jgi:hypothetical protein